MIITKEQQEAMINNYWKTHSFEEMEAFSEGMEAMLNLVSTKINKQ
tara:strand:- start:527 stop:664 length:138 start_codon:yes stop_codon:yes gene_type:complete